MKLSAKRIAIFIAIAAFGTAMVLAEFGLMRALQLALLRLIVWHCCFVLLFQTLFLVTFRFFVRPLSAKKNVLWVCLGTFIFALVWLILFGYRQFIAGVVCTGAIVCALALFSAGKDKIKWQGAVCAGLSLILIVIVSLSCFLPDKIKMDKRIKEAPLADFSDGFAHANEPKTIYHLSLSSYTAADGIMMKSLQGCLGLTSDVQILLNDNLKKIGDNYYTVPVYLQIIEKYYPDVTVIDVTEYDDLLKKVGPLIENYIYCDEDDSQSWSVAFNLCHRFRSVVVGKTYLPYAQEFGWKKVFDTTGKDQKWLMASEYFSELNKSLVFASEPIDFYGSYADYAIVSGCWFFPRPRTVLELEKVYAYLDRNFIFVSGIIEDERGMIAATSRFSGTFVFSGGMANVSTYSGFRLENAVKNEVNTASGVKKKTVSDKTNLGKGKHTVCVMLSDGDNMRYFAGQELANPRFLGSKTRTGETALTYGMSGMATLLMPITLLAHYDRMYPAEDYVVQLGSVGYVFPSQWKDEEAFVKVTDLMAQSMTVADTRVVEIMDDISFLDATDRVTSFKSLRPYFDKYTRYDQVDGCLFINFMDLYAGFGGKMCWSNGKPVVSARYSVWNSENSSLASEKNSVEYIADSINKASTDETSEDGYSFVIVHTWSGLNEKGELVPSGDALAAMNKLVGLLDDDVEVVSAEEFIRRVKTNVVR